MDPEDTKHQQQDTYPPRPSPDQVRALAAQVEALQGQVAHLYPQQNLATGAAARRGWPLGGLLAILLVLGAIVAATLVGAGFLLRSQPVAKAPQVIVAVLPSSNDLLVAALPHTPRPLSTTLPAAAAPPSATAIATGTPLPSNTPVPPTATPADTSTPEDTATAIPNDGVSVCGYDHYDKPGVLCQQRDTKVSQDAFDQAKLVYTGPQGGAFAHNALLITLSEANSEGSWTVLGTHNDTAPVGFSSQASSLAGIFTATNNTPSFDGSTYRIEVDSGDVSLGSATFGLGDGPGATAQDTATPADTPAAFVAPDDTATAVAGLPGGDYPADACSAASSPTDVVVRFYRAVDLRQFAAAYRCFDADWQAKNPYDGWVVGFASSVSSRLVLANSLPGNRVWLDLHAVDRDTTGLIARSFTGTWQVTADLRLHGATIKELRHARVAAVPSIDYRDLFLFDGRVVISQMRADVTNDGVDDRIYVTRDTGCKGCQKRHLWIYSGEELVFSATFWHGLGDVTRSADGTGFALTAPEGNQSLLWTAAGFAGNGHD